MSSASLRPRKWLETRGPLNDTQAISTGLRPAVEPGAAAVGAFPFNSITSGNFTPEPEGSSPSSPLRWWMLSFSCCMLCLHIRYGNPQWQSKHAGSRSSDKIHLRLQSLNCPLPATMPRVNYSKSALPVATRFLSVLWLLCGSCCFGQSVLTLSSAPAVPGGQVSLNISLDTAYPGKSAGLQWTLDSPAGDVASFSTVAGPAAASAQKSLYCAAKTCLLAGINSNPLGNGVVAIVTLNLSPTATGNLMVQLSNPVEALLDGSGGSITTTNGIVNVGAISVTVAPASANLYGAQSLSLSATVAGTSSNVIWTMNPQVGTLSSTGLYTAPSTISINQTIVVTATSVADPTKSGSADIHLLPVAVTLSPSTISLQPWQSTEFIANVTNASNSAVIWSLSPAFGDISNGKYSAPRRIRKPESVTVTATSVADSTKSASAIVTLVPFPLRGHRKFPPRQ